MAFSGQTIVFDLANCAGGEIESVISLASLFISSDNLIELEYYNQTKILKNDTKLISTAYDVYFFTNEFTMSAAEMFLFVMAENYPVKAILGPKPFGKIYGQRTLTSFKGRYQFSFTTFLWKINGLTSLQLSEKHFGSAKDQKYNKEQFLAYVLSKLGSSY